MSELEPTTFNERAGWIGTADWQDAVGQGATVVTVLNLRRLCADIERLTVERDALQARLEASEAGAAEMREALTSLDPLIELGKHAAKSVLFAGVVVREAEIARANALSSNAGASLLAELQGLRKQDSALRKFVRDLDDLMANSDGVAGLHRNGDVAPWDSLTTGGSFEMWLSSWDAARAALSAGTAEAEKEDKPTP